MNIKQGTKIRKLAGTLIAAALLVTVTGCPQGNGTQSGEETVNKTAFKKNIKSLSGELTVLVADNGKVEGMFTQMGKEYKGEGALAAGGAVSFDLKGEEKGEYSFKGEYDKVKKEFKHASFGMKGSLQDIVFGVEDKDYLFYYGEVTVVEYGMTGKHYTVRVAPKSESAATVIFERHDDFNKIWEPVQYSFDGQKSGNKVTAKVLIEGEHFDFETRLGDKGVLRETKLIGERGFKGDVDPLKGLVYEGKVAGGKGVYAFNGNLQMTVYISEEALQKAKRKMEEEETDVKKKKLTAAQKKTYHYTYKGLVIGQLVVRYHDLSEQRTTLMHERRADITMGMYEGQHEQALSQDAFKGVFGLKPIGGYGGVADRDSEFVLALRGKGWYTKAGMDGEFGKGKGYGVYFGRSNALIKVEDKKTHLWSVDYAASEKRGLVEVSEKLRRIEK